MQEGAERFYWSNFSERSWRSIQTDCLLEKELISAKKKGSPLSENFHVAYLISNIVPKISAEKIFEAKCNREKNWLF